MADLTLRDIKQVLWQPSTSCTASTSTSSPASSSSSSARRAAASPRCCGDRRARGDHRRATLKIDGEVVNDVPPSKRGIAMVFQSYALYPHMTVYDNMAFGLKIAKESKAEIDRRVRQAADILQLTNYLDRLPKALSGGQRQRVAIGRAIVRDPKVFLFDEPLSNLDAALRVATRIEIAKLKESMPNTTMIYVTHDQVEAMTLADRIVVLNAGQIEQVGTPMELYEHPGNLFVAGFIGSPAMNILPATIEKAGAPTVVSHVGGRTATCRSRRRPPPQGRRSASACGRRISRVATGSILSVRRAGRLCRAARRSAAGLCRHRPRRHAAGRQAAGQCRGQARRRRCGSMRQPRDLHIFDGEGHSFARRQPEVKAA